MSLPEILLNGYLPIGVHPAPLSEIISRFGVATPRRQTLADRLQELLAVARATGKLRRAFLWGSFVSGKPFPGDLDIFLLMNEGFDREFINLPKEQREVFDHGRARLLFEADVFWATEAIGTKELDSWLSVYQLSRDMVQRGIIEVRFDD
jgi:predicted nucleotidyltransferase